MHEALDKFWNKNILQSRVCNKYTWFLWKNINSVVLETRLMNKIKIKLSYSNGIEQLLIKKYFTSNFMFIELKIWIHLILWTIKLIKWVVK